MTIVQGSTVLSAFVGSRLVHKSRTQIHEYIGVFIGGAALTTYFATLDLDSSASTLSLARGAALLAGTLAFERISTALFYSNRITQALLREGPPPFDFEALFIVNALVAAFAAAALLISSGLSPSTTFSSVMEGLSWDAAALAILITLTAVFAARPNIPASAGHTLRLSTFTTLASAVINGVVYAQVGMIGALGWCAIGWTGSAVYVYTCEQQIQATTVHRASEESLLKHEIESLGDHEVNAPLKSRTSIRFPYVPPQRQCTDSLLSKDQYPTSCPSVYQYYPASPSSSCTPSCLAACSVPT